MKGFGIRRDRLLLVLSRSLHSDTERGRVLEGVCCNHQCKIIQQLVSDFIQNRLFSIKTEKKEASMGALSYSQARHFAIQYSIELIWNKPHLRPEEDNLFCFL